MTEEKSAYEKALDGELNNEESIIPPLVNMVPHDSDLDELDRKAVKDAEEPKKKKSPFTIYTAGDALKPQPPIRYMIEGVLTRPGVGILVGEPGSKKTYVLGSSGVCVASGKDWLGMKTQQGRVLYIDEESGKVRMSRRVGEILRGELSLELNDKIPFFFTCHEGFDLRTDLGAKKLYNLILETGAEYIIIDALADVMAGGDENSVKDVQPVLQRIRRIAEKTITSIMIVHHTNRMGRYRGSSAIKGVVNLMLLVKSEDKSNYIEFKSEKVQDAEPVHFAAKAHWADGSFWLTPDRLQVKMSETETTVIEYFEEHKTGTVKEAAEECKKFDISHASTRSAIYSLVRKGMLRRIDEGGRGVKAVYGPADV